MERSTSDLCDALGDQCRVLAPGLVHFGGRRRFEGEIVTVKCFEDNSRVRELVATPGEGRVLLVDGGASMRYALLGDTLGRTAVESGWSGIVIAGCVRDTAALGELSLGVMALGATPRRSLKNGEGFVGVPVDVAGVRCLPGELLVADEDGVVVLDPALRGTG